MNHYSSNCKLDPDLYWSNSSIPTQNKRVGGQESLATIKKHHMSLFIDDGNDDDEGYLFQVTSPTEFSKNLPEDEDELSALLLKMDRQGEAFRKARAKRNTPI
jgi:hypothetical protein